MPSGVCSINYSLYYGQVHKSWHYFFLICMMSLIRLITSMLGYSFILSAYLWLSLLISSLTYGMLRSWYGVSLTTYALTMILRYLFWNLWIIYVWIGCVPKLDTVSPYWFKDCLVQQQFIFDRYLQFAAEQLVAQLNFKLFSLGGYVLSPV